MFRSAAPAGALLLLLLLSTLWGASYAFIRVAVATIPPVTLVATRTLIAAGILLLYLRWQRISIPRAGSTWRQFAFQAVLNSVVPYTLLAWGQQHVEASLAVILNSCSPIFAYLATDRTSDGATRWIRLAGVGTGLLGVVVIVGTSAVRGVGDQLLPQLAIVLASMCYAGAAIYGRQFQRLDPALPAFGSMAVSALVLVPAALLLESPWRAEPSTASVQALLALSVFSTALAFVIYFQLVASLGAVGTTAQAFLRVPIGVLIGAAFLGETLHMSAFFGLIGVVLGVAAMTLPLRRN